MNDFEEGMVRVPRGRGFRATVCDERTAKRVRDLVELLQAAATEDAEQFLLQALAISGSWAQRLDWFEKQFHKALQSRKAKEESNERPS